MNRFIVAAALAASFVDAAQGAALDQFKTFVSSTKSARGEFTQTLTKNVDGAKTTSTPSTGTFVFARPGKFIWEYQKPYEQLLQADGDQLYIYDKDAPGVTNCYDACAENWPPLIADASAKADGEFTLVDRTDGSRMWAYKGWPLYYWVKDEKAGDTTGDGVGGVWHTAYE